MSTDQQQLIRAMVQSFAEIIERQVLRFENQGAEYERKMAEYCAAFGARTGADAKIIEGLRIQVQDMRAEMEQLRVDERKAYQAGVVLRAEVAQLQRPVPKRHPVAVGGYLRRLTGFNTTPAGEVARVTLVDADDPSQVEYEVVRPNGQKGRWSATGCEHCDPPATHDTEAGKAAAEAVIRESRKTEPVAEEIKVGDIIEVVSATHKIYTEPEDIGRRGVVTAIDGMRISVEAVPCYELPIRGIVGKCDVRKVT